MKTSTSGMAIGAFLALAAASCSDASIQPEELGVESQALNANQIPSYHGGPLMEPQMVPVFWGNFTAAEISGMTTYLVGLANYMAGADPPPPQGQEPVLFQYGVYGASVRGSVCDTRLPAGGHARASDLKARLASLQVSGGVDCATGQPTVLPAYTNEFLFMVFSQGITWDDMGTALADHSDWAFGQYWARIPFEKKLSGKTLDLSRKIGASHELFEAATDAQPATGWTAPNGEEIADSCGSSFSTTTPSFGGIQQVADKLQNACSIYTRQQISQITATHSGSVIDLFGLGTDRAYWHWSSNGGWESLDGTFVGPPAAVSRVVGGVKLLDVFGMGTDGAYYRRFWNGSSWQWEGLGGKFIGPPAVVSWGPDRIDLFGQSMGNGEILHGGWTTAGGWLPVNQWEHLGGTFEGPPAVVSMAPNRLDVFARGLDGAYYTKACGNGNCVNSGWVPSQTDWNRLGGIFTTPPVASTWGVNNINVVGQGTDGGYHVYGFNGVEWASVALGGVFVGPPAMLAWGPNRVDIFGQGTDFAYYHRTLVIGQGWLPPNGWEQHAMPTGFIAGPAMVSIASNRLDVFGEQPDGANTIRRRTWDGSAWQPWTSIGGAIH